MNDDSTRSPFRLEVGAKRVEREVDAELEFHLAMRTRKLIAAGMEPSAAREEALRQFGDLGRVRAECVTINHQREQSRSRAMSLANFKQDALYAIRSLGKQKLFAAVVLLILALGIGANTAMFTLLDALLLRTLPVPAPHRLVTIGDPTRTSSFSTGSPRTDIFSYPYYKDLRDQNRSLSGLYASGRTGRLDVVIPEEGAGIGHPRGRFVSGNFFTALGVQAARGRLFTQREDEAPGRDPVAVISYGYWQRRFAGNPAVVGKSITVNGAGLTIIGVAEQGFSGDIVGNAMDLWMPVMMQPLVNPHTDWLNNRGVNWLILMGRLAPRITLEAARSEIITLGTRSLRDHATGTDRENVERDLTKRPIQVAAGGRGFSYFRQSYGSAVITLMAAVGLVLLVVCANVANLMLARAVARGRELSLRMALGAGRLRLMQQLLTESVLLSLGGGALGLLVAVWGSSALLKLAGGGPSPIPLATHLDGRILGFTALLSLITATLFGVIPSLRSTRVDLATALRTQGRSVAGGSGKPGKLAAAKLLVVGQVALSLLLLVGTGMLVRSLRRLQQVDVGVPRESLAIASVDAQRAGYAGPRLNALIRDLTDRASRVPGAVAATASENGLFNGTESGAHVDVEGFIPRSDDDRQIAYDDVLPGYFSAIGARLLQGRDVEARDNESGPKVAVVNQTLAKFYFPKASPLGHHLTMDNVAYEIVGVVADVEEHDLRNAPQRRAYLAMMQLGGEVPKEFEIIARSGGDPARLIEPLTRAIRNADPQLLLSGVSTLTDLTTDSISQDILVAKVVSGFGLLTLLLAALGLYGVMAHASARRTTEFGLRMALGARPGTVTGMVLKESLLMVLGGVLLGLPAALLAMRLVQHQLFGVSPIDPPSLVFAAGVLLASALAAGYLPARRAARVAPLEAIRAD